MKRYSLPIDLKTCEDIGAFDEWSVDMSKLNFNVPSDKQKHAAFVFLRNSGIKAALDFSDCSYEDKEEYLLMFLQEEIDVNAEILASTWIEILSARDGGGVVLPSILTSNEIQTFLERNSEFITEVYQLINSLPIYSMYISPMNGTVFNTDDFKRNTSHKIKITNFAKLARYNAFVLLIDGKTKRYFYEKLFIKNEPRINEMMSHLPFLGLLTAMLAPPEIQDKLANGINEFLVPGSTKQGKDETANADG